MFPVQHSVLSDTSSLPLGGLKTIVLICIYLDVSESSFFCWFISYCNCFSGKCLFMPFAHFFYCVNLFLELYYTLVTKEISSLSEVSQIFSPSLSCILPLAMYLCGDCAKILYFYVAKCIHLVFFLTCEFNVTLRKVHSEIIFNSPTLSPCPLFSPPPHPLNILDSCGIYFCVQSEVGLHLCGHSTVPTPFMKVV